MLSVINKSGTDSSLDYNTVRISSPINFSSIFGSGY